VHVARSPVRPRLPPHVALQRRMSNRRSAFHRVAINPGFPESPCRTPFVIERVAQQRTPFSPWNRRRARQRAKRKLPWAAPRCRLALRLVERRDARCVEPISAISRLRTSTRASLVSPMDYPLAHAIIVGDRLFTSERFASVDRTISLFLHCSGRCLPIAMRVDRTSDISVALPIAKA